MLSQFACFFLVVATQLTRPMLLQSTKIRRLNGEKTALKTKYSLSSGISAGSDAELKG